MCGINSVILDSNIRSEGVRLGTPSLSVIYMYGAELKK